jgi:hypothetical protein
MIFLIFSRVMGAPYPLREAVRIIIVVISGLKNQTGKNLRGGV